MGWFEWFEWLYELAVREDRMMAEARAKSAQPEKLAMVYLDGDPLVVAHVNRAWIRREPPVST